MIFRKIFRHRFIYVALLFVMLITLIIINYFSKSTHELSSLSKTRKNFLNKIIQSDEYKSNEIISSSDDSNNNQLSSIKCSIIEETNATVKTVDKFAYFKFDDIWVKQRNGIWQKDFDTRYNNLKNDKNRPPLKVFILPHSHNDPGWLKTFQGYFEENTKLIINMIVKKLTQFQEMRFVWTEISFLDLWWQSASNSQKQNFKKLVKEGRLEIMTGGWVMTDEANVHLYAMLDQLIEGHQWVKINLDVSPKIGWSIDPFGQGSTVPHLLAKSGFEGAIIQRIHYNWKEYFARHQQGDFLWKSYWKTSHSSEYTLLTHNMPFDIYSTRHSCGPVPYICDNFDFEKLPPRINESNIAHNADLLYQQYSKLASLFTHNVAFVLVGGDFAYSKEVEFDNHYSGYRRLIDYVNKNSDSKFNGATLQFGTPHDYFNEIRKRQNQDFPTLVGDFFPYADIFSTGMPAYWTGYFTTRPYYKFMSRQLEHHLRSAEILFTIIINMAKQLEKQEIFVKRMEKEYQNVIEARRNLGLFQHHDAITGTSKGRVMKDYLERLKKSMKNAVEIQEIAIKFLLQSNENDFQIIGMDYPKNNEKMIFDVKTDKEKKIVLFNSLAQDRFEMVSILTTSSQIKVTDGAKNDIKFQINPVFNSMNNFEISNENFEVNFLVKIPAMSLTLVYLSQMQKTSEKKVKISCTKCIKNSSFDISDLNGPIEIQNSEVKLIFDEHTGFLKSMKHAKYDEMRKIEISFGGYKSEVYKSGSYLFKPNSQTPEHDDIFKISPITKIYVIKGELASDVTVIRGPLLIHTVRIFHTETYLDSAISVNNIIDFEEENKNLELEMVMRINTDIENDMKNNNETEFFTDLNSFQWQPRRATRKLGIEGNYYPITSSVFIQDRVQRLSLLTTHAQGTTSFKKGELEVMLDRRIPYDDARGMGEGVLDSVKMEHKFWLLFEFFGNSIKHGEPKNIKNYQTLSFLGNHLSNSLNYPINLYSAEGDVKVSELELFSSKLPCDIHLVNLRTLSDIELDWLPSANILFILYRLGSDCQLLNDKLIEQICKPNNKFSDINFLKNLKVSKILKTSLTGLEDGKSIKSIRYDSLDAMEIRSYKVIIS